MSDPDLVVGIDFGMTCTAVAFSWAPEWPKPETIQHWPGKLISENINKVATLVAYAPNSRSVKAWGFLCNHDLQDSDIKEYFKLELDPDYNPTNPTRNPVDEARHWFRDFMQQLHLYLAEVLTDRFPHWTSQKVDFLFSVPTTWKSPHMIIDIKKLLSEAGFGHDGRNHSVEVPLTESEAAAVYAAKQQYKKGDVILVCDAGGGTTDINMLKLDSAPGEPAELIQLGFVEGQAIGSTLIDLGFQRLIEQQLNNIRHLLPDDPLTLAEKMTHGRFESFKCSYGYGAGSEMPSIPIMVPGLRPGSNFPALDIEDSQLRLKRENLRELFDRQINRMITLIDTQLETLQRNHPSERVSYLVLSGGLGSSPYVRRKLTSQYEMIATAEMLNARGIRIRSVPEPQLAVVHGLVMNRTQRIVHRQEVFKQRCCRASYGVLVNQPYNPAKHTGEPTYKSDFDGKNWALDQIDWLITQGMPIHNNSVKKVYCKDFAPGREGDPWFAQIVMSDYPPDQLPPSLKYDRARIICRVETVLPKQEMTAKNNGLFHRKPKYFYSEFYLNVILGVADLKIQILSKDGVTCNRDHDMIEVQWVEPSNPPSRPPYAPLITFSFHLQCLIKNLPMSPLRNSAPALARSLRLVVAKKHFLISTPTGMQRGSTHYYAMGTRGQVEEVLCELGDTDRLPRASGVMVLLRSLEPTTRQDQAGHAATTIGAVSLSRRGTSPVDIPGDRWFPAEDLQAAMGVAVQDQLQVAWGFPDLASGGLVEALIGACSEEEEGIQGVDVLEVVGASSRPGKGL